MGGSYCHVVGCSSKYGKTLKREGKEEKVRMFKPPTSNHLFAQWKIAVDRKDKPFTDDCRICSKHFNDDCFSKGKYSKDPGPDGKRVLLVEHTNWQLEPKSVPTLHLGNYSKILKLI